MSAILKTCVLETHESREEDLASSGSVCCQNSDPSPQGTVAGSFGDESNSLVCKEPQIPYVLRPGTRISRLLQGLRGQKYCQNVSQMQFTPSEDLFQSLSEKPGGEKRGGVILRRRNFDGDFEYLVIRGVPDSNGISKFGFPKGKSEDQAPHWDKRKRQMTRQDANLANTAFSELGEETGISIGRTERLLCAFSNRDGLFLLIETSRIDLKVKIQPDEIAEFQWVTLEELNRRIDDERRDWNAVTKTLVRKLREPKQTR